MFIPSFCSKSLIWVLVSFPSLLVPCMFIFITFFIAFTFSSILWPYSTISVNILITSILNSASNRLAIYSLLSSIFEALVCFFIWAIFFILVCFLHCKGWSLKYLPGWGNQHCCVVVLLCGGWVWGGTLPRALLSARFQSLPPPPTSKLDPSSADYPVGAFGYILKSCGSLQWISC